MRIVIDLQACQTDSQTRGIGRYSLALAKALARRQGQHELRFALNDLFGGRAKAVCEEFTGLAAPGMFSYYKYPPFDHRLDFSGNYQRRLAGALVRNHYAHLRPDILHISSLFEGWYSQAVVPAQLAKLPGVICSATLYDLIPLIMPDRYMLTDALQHFYEQKFRLLQECDLLLAISEASRRDAIDYLGINPESVVTISGAADAHFRPGNVSADEAQALRQRYGLKEKFVLYTGGLDYRKNLEGAISGYARIPPTVRQPCQFVIICALDAANQAILLQHAASEGLAEGEVIFTGFVPETDLIGLYNLCTLFIFPSLYEGFGLPVLEAMACGAAVLGADNSSISELIGRRDALFDGKSPEAIARALYKGLTDEGYRTDLRAWSLRCAKTFSWDSSAAKALAAFEEAWERSGPRDVCITARFLPRRKMAYFSPLPDQDGGTCRRAAELFAYLARYYDLHIFADVSTEISPYMLRNFSVFSYETFAARSRDYEIVVYSLGQSPRHAYMYDLIQQYPGVVVLHDFFLGGLLCHIAGTDPAKSTLFSTELAYSHGPAALELLERSGGTARAAAQYPCNRRVLDAATGVIVHSSAMRELVKQFYPSGIAASLEYIDLAQHPVRIAAHYALILEKYTQQHFARHTSVLAAQLGEILAPWTFSEAELTAIGECAAANIPDFRPSQGINNTCDDEIGMRNAIMED